MDGELVSAGRDLKQRLGIQLAVDRLDEEGGVQATDVELVQQAREHVGDRGMLTERRVSRPGAPLQVGGFTEVVERQSHVSLPAGVDRPSSKSS